MQVEDALLDTYDLVFDRAVTSPSARRQELAAIHDTVSAAGPIAPRAARQGLSRGPSHRPRICCRDRGSGLLPGPGQGCRGLSGSRTECKAPVHERWRVAGL